jgi:hypothetical protein
VWNRRLRVGGRWARRGAWWIATWALGVRACDTIRPLFGGPVAPTTSQIILIVLFAVIAGTLGGALLVGRGWQGVAFASLIGTAIWSLAFAGEIPTTYSVCGGDAAGGCDHVMGFWWIATALLAFVPVAAGLLLATGLWWTFVPRTRHIASDTAAPLSSLPPTEQQIAWAQFQADGSASRESIQECSP